MANEAYIYRLRADLGAGAFQITDLTPNTSRKTAVLQGQSGYMPALVQTPTNIAALGAGGVTTAAGQGLEAYILATTNDYANGGQISCAAAHAAAALILARLAAGTPVTEVEVSADVDAGFLSDGGIVSTGSLPWASTIPGSTLGTAAGGGGVASIGSQLGMMKSIFAPTGFTYAAGGQADAATDGGAVGPATAVTYAAAASWDDDGYRQLPPLSTTAWGRSSPSRSPRWPKL